MLNLSHIHTFTIVFTFVVLLIVSIRLFIRRNELKGFKLLPEIKQVITTEHLDYHILLLIYKIYFFYMFFYILVMLTLFLEKN
jgi:hypothetical protein